MKTADTAAIIGIGVTAGLVVAGGIWKAASLRGDQNLRWSERVAAAVTALTEKTIEELRVLRDDIEDFLPDGKPFTTEQAIADPAPLSDQASNVAILFRTAKRMDGDLRRLRRLGPALVAALTAMLFAVLGLTAHFAELLGWGWLRLTSLLVLAAAAVAVLGLAALYIFLQHRLATAEIRAGTTVRPPDAE